MKAPDGMEGHTHSTKKKKIAYVFLYILLGMEGQMIFLDSRASLSGPALSDELFISISQGLHIDRGIYIGSVPYSNTCTHTVF